MSQQPSVTALNAGQQYRKQFSMRSHPPLQSNFQQPNETSTIDDSMTLKRSMYKKLQLSEPTGKCKKTYFSFYINCTLYLFYFILSYQDHGADDDLKLLNVIESYWKAKMRQSFNLNVQEAISSTANKSVVLPQLPKTDDQSLSTLNKKRENDEKKYKIQIDESIN